MFSQAAASSPSADSDLIAKAAGGDERALRVMRKLQVACEATSLGGVESLVSTPFNSSHFSLTRDERLAARIDDGMIRVSCGVEPSDDLIADFTVHRATLARHARSSSAAP